MEEDLSQWAQGLTKTIPVCGRKPYQTLLFVVLITDSHQIQDFLRRLMTFGKLTFGLFSMLSSSLDEMPKRSFLLEILQEAIWYLPWQWWPLRGNLGFQMVLSPAMQAQSYPGRSFGLHCCFRWTIWSWLKASWIFVKTHTRLKGILYLALV